MKIKNKISLIFIMLFMFMFKIDTVSAATSCEYRMYPVGYSFYDDELVSVYSSSYDYFATVKYTGSKKLQRISDVTELYQKIDTFNDSNFHKTVKGNNVDCPYYVYAKKDDLKIIEGTEFTKKSGVYLSNTNYVMFLVKQDDKKVETPIKFAFNAFFNHWKTLISNQNKELNNLGCPSNITNAETYGMDEQSYFEYVKGSYANRNEKDKNLTESCWNQRIEYASAIAAARNFYNVLEKQGTDLKYAKQSANWSTFYQFSLKGTGASSKTNEYNLKEQQGDNAQKDYCYFYCDAITCKNQPVGAAKDNCIKGCNGNIKSECDKAYNACKSVGSSADKTACIKGKLQAAGLDPNYTEIQAQEMVALQEEIKKLKEEIETVTASEIKIDFEPYKVSCDDVAMFHDIWVIITILAPVLTILMGVLDFGKAVISSDVEKMNKAWKKFPKRVLAVVLLILIPLLISLLLSITTDENAGDTSLMYCIINGGE